MEATTTQIPEWIKQEISNLRISVESILSCARRRQRHEPEQWESWELPQCGREVRALRARINPRITYTERREIEKDASRLRERYCPPMSWITGPNGDGYQ